MWTAYVKVDVDKIASKVCDATAIWNVGQPDEFTYSRRVTGGISGDVNAFIKESQGALVAYQSLTGLEYTLSQNLANKLNA